ncbi:MAG: carboxypeptidase-like regulatory domain-containing protein [Acidobacteria bacterium]|nr:carboxypeptidase-like regulatory domain-containing protein [Acidobacteriota bacterium]
MFRPAWTRPRGRRRGIVAACLVAVGVASSQRDSEAYRLYDNGALDYIVPASEAIRWSPDVWGSGGTLSWEIEDSPDWPLLQDHLTDDFETFVQEALSRWAGVAAADISWRLTGFRGRTDGPRFGNGRHQVFFEADSGIRGAVAWWIRNHQSEAWEITECDVGVGREWVDRFEDGAADTETLERWLQGFLAQEFGHCLGLGQAPTLPASRVLRASPDEQYRHGTQVWTTPSAMGWWEARLAEDDRVGASLLRPRPGWLSGAGSLAGMLQSEGGPVPYAHVFALRGGPDGLRDPVGAFTNADGEFLIEGLPPGESRQRLGSLDGRGSPGAARPGVGAPGGRRSPPGPNRCVQ